MAAKKGPPVPAKVAELLTTARRELRACLLVSEQQLAAISETRDREPALRTKLDRLLARETKWEGREKVAKHRYDELAKMEALAIERATVVEEFDTQKRLLTRQITSQLAKSSDEKVSIPEELLQMFDKIGNSHLLLAELSGVIEAGGKVLAETFEQIGTRGSELDVLTDRDIKRMVMYFSRIFPMLNQRLEDFIVRIEEEEKSVMEVTSLRSAEATKTSKDTLEALQQKWKESTLASYALPPKEDAPMSAAPSQNKQSQSQSLVAALSSAAMTFEPIPKTVEESASSDSEDDKSESNSRRRSSAGPRVLSKHELLRKRRLTSSSSTSSTTTASSVPPRGLSSPVIRAGQTPTSHAVNNQRTLLEANNVVKAPASAKYGNVASAPAQASSPARKEATLPAAGEAVSDEVDIVESTETSKSASKTSKAVTTTHAMSSPTKTGAVAASKQVGKKDKNPAPSKNGTLQWPTKRPLAAMPATPAKKRAVINLDLDDEEEESGSDLSDVVAIDLSASEPKSPAPGSKRPRIANKSSISEKDAGVHPARPVTLENLPSHIFDPKFIGQAPNHPTLTGLVGSNIKIRWSADSPEVAYTVAAIKKQAVWYFLLKAANPETVPKAIRLRLDGKGKVYHVHLYDPFVSRTVTAESSYRVV